MTYRRHGNVPTDADIAALGYKAFGPRREPFVPTGDDWAAAAKDVATGDSDELRDLAVEVAGYWPDDDDEYPCGAWWVV